MRVDHTDLPAPAVVVFVNDEPVLLLSTDLPRELRACLARVLEPVSVSGASVYRQLPQAG